MTKTNHKDPELKDKRYWSVDNHTWYQCPIEVELIEQAFLSIGLVQLIEFSFLFREQIQQVQKQYLGKDYPADSLSFPAESPEYPATVLLCPEEINAYCQFHKVPLVLRWTHLVIHAALHTFGYDHIDQQQFSKMIELERKLLALTPIGTSYTLTQSYTYLYKVD